MIPKEGAHRGSIIRFKGWEVIQLQVFLLEIGHNLRSLSITDHVPGASPVLSWVAWEGFDSCGDWPLVLQDQSNATSLNLSLGQSCLLGWLPVEMTSAFPEQGWRNSLKEMDLKELDELGGMHGIRIFPNVPLTAQFRSKFCFLDHSSVSTFSTFFLPLSFFRNIVWMSVYPDYLCSYTSEWCLFLWWSFRTLETKVFWLGTLFYPLPFFPQPLLCGEQ